MTKLTSLASSALEFSKAFGLTTTAVEFHTDTSTSVAVPLSSTPATPPPSHDPSSDQRKRATQVIYLLDRSGVSDEFYHELAQVRSCE